MAAAAEFRKMREERAQAYRRHCGKSLDSRPNLEVGDTRSDGKSQAQSFGEQLQAVRDARRQGFLRGASQPASSIGHPVLDEIVENDVCGCHCEHESECREMLAHCNTERARHGCEAVVWNARLAHIARLSALRMARRELPFSHSGADDRFASYPLGGGDCYAENLARSQGIRPLAPAVVRGWCDSPGHFRNLTTSLFTSCGIGAATDATGVTFVVQLLARIPTDLHNAGINEGNDAQSSHAFETTQESADASTPTQISASRVSLSSASSSFFFLIAILGVLVYKGGWMFPR